MKSGKSTGETRASLINTVLEKIKQHYQESNLDGLIYSLSSILSAPLLMTRSPFGAFWTEMICNDP